MNVHRYRVELSWSASGSVGTRDYRSYGRDHTLGVEGKPPILASSDPHFRGTASRYNPEELFVASLSSCHMLWYLHLCSTRSIVVMEYRDSAVGEMQMHADGSGEFTKVTLHPEVTMAAGDSNAALSLHEQAHHMCFVARSVNCAVLVEPVLARI
jgi:organic hydroperoxide reductase OsmC/OhrA